MNPTQTSTDGILKREAVGFSLIIALCWIVELLQVPHLFFHEAAGFNWQRVLFRTVVLVAIWLWTHRTNKRLLKRLHHLEAFLLLCSWCRKIGHEGRWLTTEEYFGSRFETKTSHGICPKCALEQAEQLAAHGEEVG